MNLRESGRNNLAEWGRNLSNAKHEEPQRSVYGVMWGLSPMFGQLQKCLVEAEPTSRRMKVVWNFTTVVFKLGYARTSEWVCENIQGR
jgi:hypothetical protein